MTSEVQHTTGQEPQLGGPDRPGGDEPLLGGEKGIQPWLDALNSGDNAAIWRAARELAEKGEYAVPRLVDALHHPDHRVQAVAAWALARLAGQDAALDAAPRLADLLNSPAQTVRILAGRALRQIVTHHPQTPENVKAALTEFRKRRP